MKSKTQKLKAKMRRILNDAQRTGSPYLQRQALALQQKMAKMDKQLKLELS
jgi:hypothetical protein